MRPAEGKSEAGMRTSGISAPGGCGGTEVCGNIAPGRRNRSEIVDAGIKCAAAIFLIPVLIVAIPLIVKSVIPSGMAE